MFGSEVTVYADKPCGKVATLKGKIEVSINIRNQFNKGIAKTDFLRSRLRRRTGDYILFAGTNFEFGGRSIEVLRDGKELVWLGENCATGGYSGSDARAFAALYEKLAQQARAAFEVKPAPASYRNRSSAK